MSRRGSQGFTLVEILVSIAVLVMLVLLVDQLFNSATATATVSRKHIDADEAAREVFDRMGADIAAMVRRPDVNYIFCKNGRSSTSGSSDAMFFYSEGPGYLDPGVTSATMAATGSASTLSLVGYRINPNNQYYPGIPVLERLGENLTWSGAPTNANPPVNPGCPVFLTYPLTSASTTLAGNWTYTLGAPPYTIGSDSEHYQVLSEMVFRMEFSFVLKSGTYAYPGGSAVTGTTGYSNAPTSLSGTIPQPYVTGTNYFNGGGYPGGGWAEPAGNVYGFPPDLGAIVVTIAVMDNTTRKQVSNSALGTLAASLPDSLAGNTTIGSVQAAPELTSQVWQDVLMNPGFAQTTGISQGALQQVRVYERTFYLDAN